VGNDRLRFTGENKAARALPRFERRAFDGPLALGKGAVLVEGEEGPKASTAAILLRHYAWNAEKLQEQFWNDPAAALEAAGLSPPSSPSTSTAPLPNAGIPGVVTEENRSGGGLGFSQGLQPIQVRRLTGTSRSVWIFWRYTMSLVLQWKVRDDIHCSRSILTGQKLLRRNPTMCPIKSGPCRRSSICRGGRSRSPLKD
jgi:hypothetical protein